jgi:hypothetical protein
MIMRYSGNYSLVSPHVRELPETREIVPQSSPNGQTEVRLVLDLKPDGRRTPVPLVVFARSVLKHLLRVAGWKCVGVTWEDKQ